MLRFHWLNLKSRIGRYPDISRGGTKDPEAAPGRSASGMPESTGTTIAARERVDHLETCAQDRDQNQLGDPLAHPDTEIARVPGSSTTRTAAPDNRSRSDRPGCQGRSRACGQARSAAGSGRRHPGSPMWIAIPVGMSSLSPGPRSSGSSSMARRSSPAEPSVAYSGSGWSRPSLGSRILT